MTVRVVLIDDHPVVRAGLRALLDSKMDLEVVGEAPSGTQAIALVCALRPDVAIVDLLLPDMDGVEVTQSIRREAPGTHVLVLTSLAEEAPMVARAIRAGAIGCVSKNAELDFLAESVRSAAAGQAQLPARLAARLIEDVRCVAAEAALTAREREVLREVALGRSNKEIARALDISLTTVKSHLRVILDKLGVQSRTQAALHAHRSATFAAE